MRHCVKMEGSEHVGTLFRAEVLQHSWQLWSHFNGYTQCDDNDGDPVNNMCASPRQHSASGFAACGTTCGLAHYNAKSAR